MGDMPREHLLCYTGIQSASCCAQSYSVLQGDERGACAPFELRITLSACSAAPRLGPAADCRDAQLPMRRGTIPRCARSMPCCWAASCRPAGAVFLQYLCKTQSLAFFQL